MAEEQLIAEQDGITIELFAIVQIMMVCLMAYLPTTAYGMFVWLPLVFFIGLFFVRFHTSWVVNWTNQRLIKNYRGFSQWCEMSRLELKNIDSVEVLKKVTHGKYASCEFRVSVFTCHRREYRLKTFKTDYDTYETVQKEANAFRDEVEAMLLGDREKVRDVNSVISEADDHFDEFWDAGS